MEDSTDKAGENEVGESADIAREALATVQQIAGHKDPKKIIYPAEATAIGVVAALSAMQKH